MYVLPYRADFIKSWSTEQAMVKKMNAAEYTEEQVYADITKLSGMAKELHGHLLKFC